MLPTIRAFMAAHQLADVTVVADAGMISASNMRGIEAGGLSFILGARSLTSLTWSPSGTASTPTRNAARQHEPPGETTATRLSRVEPAREIVGHR